MHPALVHVPLGLAFVIPFVALALTVVVWRGVMPRKAWAMMVALQAALVAGGVVAIRTGGAEEERVEDVVSGQAIEHHEKAAMLFVWTAAGVLALASLGLLLPIKAARWAALVTTAATNGVAGLGMRAGHEGGVLVYRLGCRAREPAQR